MTGQLPESARLITLRQAHPLRIGSPAAVRQEYEVSARAVEPWERLRWGSAEGMRQRLVMAAARMRPLAPRIVVDIGCGTGDLFEYLRRELPSARFIGIDMTKALLRQAVAVPGAAYAQARAEAIPMRDGTADAVTLIGIAQNCGMTLAALLREAARVLRCGGWLFLVTKHLGWEKFLTGELDPDLEHNWFTRAEIETALAACGCAVRRCEGFLPRSGETVSPRQSHEIVCLAERVA